MQIFHDPSKQINFLSQILSNGKKPLAFFISAGCPLGVTMPAGAWPLIPAIKELSQKVNVHFAEPGNISHRYQDLLQEISSDGIDHENIEQVLSFIRALGHVAGKGKVRGFSQNDLAEIEKVICHKIVDLIDVALPDSETPYHQLSAWIASIDREQAVDIFTTNYDLLLEQALEESLIPYFDGFVGSRNSFFDLKAVEDNQIPKHWTRVWKIHGSLNWYKSDSKIHRSTGVKIDSINSPLIYPSHLKYDQSRKMPYLALLDHLTRSIKNDSSVLITSGYSFNDDHINDAMLNALVANPSSMIVALLFGNLEGYPKALAMAKSRPNIGLWALDEAMIGTKRGKWKVVKYNPEDNIAGVIQTEDIQDPNDGSKTLKTWKLQLGDFRHFGNFLHHLVVQDNQPAK
ncbi:SIR2 family protein [Dyadobacter fermentans]|uniref:Uncharacterized protein n=1 Tax=Dyadobacter fermentans (strain ATCC 700827 / DSM 18053 / CIP 107007 / KCTC 52180 / NS114) TaxID=471854 RepID=C6W2W5_DYAFD|nr:SIR2 family protein [Dyadobacter fermentans]ACT95678.1 conserved hypothetical protein [Dyadobacter fermentans DSM 18053]